MENNYNAISFIYSFCTRSIKTHWLRSSSSYPVSRLFLQLCSQTWLQRLMFIAKWSPLKDPRCLILEVSFKCHSAAPINRNCWLSPRISVTYLTKNSNRLEENNSTFIVFLLSPPLNPSQCKNKTCGFSLSHLSPRGRWLFNTLGVSSRAQHAMNWDFPLSNLMLFLYTCVFLCVAQTFIRWSHTVLSLLCPFTLVCYYSLGFFEG